MTGDLAKIAGSYAASAGRADSGQVKTLDSWEFIDAVARRAGRIVL